MKFLLYLGVFYWIACSNRPKEENFQISKLLPDSSNSFYAKQFHRDYLDTRRIQNLFTLNDISNGTDKIELRLWNISSTYDPQSIYILKQSKHDEWNLRVINYYRSLKDSITQETNMAFRGGLIDSLNLDKYWALPSQSEIKNGDDYGCMDGNTVLLELSDKRRYKYIVFRCPELHVNKDSAFYLINILHEGLRSLAKEL